MDLYVEQHLESGAYITAERGYFVNKDGWVDHRIGRHIVFSHRRTDYAKKQFRDALHVHDYCEILFWREGNVQYVSGDRTEHPRVGGVIVIPPGQVHTTRLLRPSVYERYVLYLSPEAFSGLGGALCSFARRGAESFSAVFGEDRAAEPMKILSRIEERLVDGGDTAEIGAYACVIELLLSVRALFSSEADSEKATSAGKYLPQPVREIRRCIEEEYASIPSVEALAERFYYSREYVTRLFRRYYNLSPGDYLEQCRIRAAETKISQGKKISDVCFDVGYRSMSAFSAAFRRVTGKTPSAYKVRNRNIHK